MVISKSRRLWSRYTPRKIIQYINIQYTGKQALGHGQNIGECLPVEMQKCQKYIEIHTVISEKNVLCLSTEQRSTLVRSSEKSSREHLLTYTDGK